MTYMLYEKKNTPGSHNKQVKKMSMDMLSR